MRMLKAMLKHPGPACMTARALPVSNLSLALSPAQCLDIETQIALRATNLQNFCTLVKKNHLCLGRSRVLCISESNMLPETLSLLHVNCRSSTARTSRTAILIPLSNLRAARSLSLSLVLLPFRISQTRIKVSAQVVLLRRCRPFFPYRSANMMNNSACHPIARRFGC